MQPLLTNNTVPLSNIGKTVLIVKSKTDILELRYFSVKSRCPSISKLFKINIFFFPIACYIGCQKGTAIKIAAPSIFSYILMILTYNALILSNATTEFSYVPNAVSLKYPSPLGPNPDPGVPTTLAFSKR